MNTPGAMVIWDADIRLAAASCDAPLTQAGVAQLTEIVLIELLCHHTDESPPRPNAPPGHYYGQSNQQNA